jgi:putative FmdB family regulatory protein
MPLYEYQCADCDRPFELFVRSAALAEGAVCQHCHSPRVRRRVSGFATTRSLGSAPVAMVDAPRGGGCACGGGGCGCGGH